MNIWLFRAGKHGEYENKFLEDKRVYLTWDDLNINLKEYPDKRVLELLLIEKYNLEKEKTATNWVSQILPIAHRMEVGDWVVLPSKVNRTIHFGKITGDYCHNPYAENPYYHYREVNWFATDIPRDNFEQDILYSMGAFMTVCRIHKNNAKDRLLAMEKNNWKVPNKVVLNQVGENEIEDNEENLDLEEIVADRISKHIIRNFKGHKMEILIEEILKAKGFTTFRSPEGADNGVDILASPNTLGFGSPKICVQVKTTDSPVDRPTMDQLIGTMSNVNAEYGLLVSWSGFKSSVKKEIPKQFFRLRLWDSAQIIKQIFESYELLSDEIKSEIPLKRVWMLNNEDI
ncbi:restriction endonuclease [Metaclostridioides mangenotii]|uniref:restriction endonuclease n=1 Tax=Metaclostridioides mangenotii TaxID=1540 RepID=UPI0026EC29E8|nr:restriction endonuclease [Clostridioides mangenotii]